jgi:hypothetical protein
LPFWLNLALMFFVELAKRLAEENELK